MEDARLRGTAEWDRAAALGHTPGAHLGGVSEVSATHPAGVSPPRAPAGTKTIIERASGEPVRRTNVNFPVSTWEAMAAHRAARRTQSTETMSEFVSRAVLLLLQEEAAAELVDESPVPEQPRGRGPKP